MPAIQPAKLKIQAAELVGSFSQPEQFARQLHNLLDSYADHAHRAGQSGEPASLLQSYNTPPPVLRQVTLELRRKASTDRTAALALADRLWREPTLEFRLLAAHLLGQIAPAPSQDVTVRLMGWVRANPDDQLLRGIVSAALEGLCQADSASVLALAQVWLSDPGLAAQRAGLAALQTLASSPNFANLPAVFRLALPYLRKAPLEIRPQVTDLVRTLAWISPQETAYVLQENLTAPENPDTPWLIRQVLAEMPESQQRTLRLALQALRGQK
jgi:hypothetical protein